MKKFLVATCLLLLVFGIAVGGLLYYQHTQNIDKAYLDFVDESFSIIKTNYWEVIEDKNLTNLYHLALEKITGEKVAEPVSNVKQLNDILKTVLRGKENDQKAEMVTQLVDMVLINLQPFGRSRLYSQKQETDLSNLVKNVSGEDRYQQLGVDKNASAEQIKQASDKKQKELEVAEKSATSSAEKQVIAQQKAAVGQSTKILTNEDSKLVYDESGVEPTLDYTLISPRIFYLHLTKFSPTSLDEIQRVATKYDKGDLLDTLILDLSDNIGGAIDGLPYFLGPFIGKDQYAYQFYQQGNKTDYKTQIGWLPTLVRYKRVVIIINENTQSTGEVMASVLKKYNVGLLVGKTTKGWGTVERVFPMTKQVSASELYSIFLVHSVTLREDGQPIQDRGVEPVVDVGKEGWEMEFKKYYNDLTLLETIKKYL